MVKRFIKNLDNNRLLPGGKYVLAITYAKNKIWATKLSNLFAFVQPGFFVTKRGIQA